MSSDHAGSWEEAVAWLRRQPDKQQLVHECYFDLPLVDAARRYHDSEEWRAVRVLIGESRGRALDVGAGAGIASYALARDGWRVTAVEPDPSETVGAGAIKLLAEQDLLPIEVIQDHGEKLPFNDNAFELIHARQVLHHARDLSQFTRELFRVLKPGGLLIATREHVISRPEQLPEFLARHPLHSLYGGEHAFTKAEYLNALQGAGFGVLRVMRPWDSPINYAPLTRQTLAKALAERFGGHRLVRAAARLGTGSTLFPWACRLLSLVDRRPGRLYSFLTIKAAG